MLICSLFLCSALTDALLALKPRFSNFYLKGMFLIKLSISVVPDVCLKNCFWCAMINSCALLCQLLLNSFVILSLLQVVANLNDLIFLGVSDLGEAKELQNKPRLINACHLSM